MVQHQPPFSPALLTVYVTLFPHWMCWCCCAQGMSGTTPGGARSPSPHLTCRTLPYLDCPRCVLSSDARGCLPQVCLVDVAPSCSFPSSLCVLLLSCWCGPIGGRRSGCCFLVTLAESALCVPIPCSPTPPPACTPVAGVVPPQLTLASFTSPLLSFELFVDMGITPPFPAPGWT